MTLRSHVHIIAATIFSVNVTVTRLQSLPLPFLHPLPLPALAAEGILSDRKNYLPRDMLAIGVVVS